MVWETVLSTNVSRDAQITIVDIPYPGGLKCFGQIFLAELWAISA